MANTYLTRTPSSAGNRTTWTWSAWVKRSTTGSASSLFGVHYSSGAYQDNLYFQSSGKLDWFIWNNNAYAGRITTDRLFRDVSAWYHVVCVYDNTLATATDRMKLYVNGVRETSLSNVTNPVQNSTLSNVNTTNPFILGNDGNGNNHFDGSMSHIHFIDGTAYDATAFGEYDANGVWKIKTSPSVTYGTNGFFILKDGNSVTDQSGNGNNFTVGGGTLTNTLDCPDNVFATWNGVMDFASSGTFSNGNTQWNSGAASNRFWCTSSIGVSTGKWYVEMKNTVQAGHNLIGIAPRSAPALNWYFGGSGTVANADDDYQWGYKAENGNIVNNTNSTSYGNTYGTTDIIGIALDLDNNKLYFSKNGTWQNSGDPTSGATGTGAVSITSASSNPTGVYHIVGANATSSDSSTFQANFGNGYFGTTAVSSAGTNASGIGIFEFDCPDGYTALSTKGYNL